MIRFNVPLHLGNELSYIQDVFEKQKLSGDGLYSKRCHKWFEDEIGIPKALLTTSCTHALEMAAILSEIKLGDEVIAPSFTFVSTVNAFILRGAKIVFVDIRPDTMNIDENLIEAAITEKTKAIVPVHYAGVSCEMDKILEIAKKYNLLVIEDAAQGMMSKYKNQYLGTIGDLGTYSFHETKNYTMGEGGALLIGNQDYSERAEIIREKGTDRSRFLRGQIDKYTWIDIGSSYLPNEISAACLYAQLELAEMINDNRLTSWKIYYEGLEELMDSGYVKLPVIPKECKHNAHMFYIKCKDLEERTRLINYLKDNNISTAFHYIPLHTSVAGRKYGRFSGEDIYTTIESEKLLRLPMYYNIEREKVLFVIKKIKEFYCG